jgi:signal transduction histidine kinase
LYRIVQEGLANVIRHSGATEVHVSVETTDTATVLTIRDNGRGMPSDQLSDPHSLGLLGIRERAELLGGAVRIESSGRGTSLEVTLPLTQGDQQATPPAATIALAKDDHPC